MQKKSMILSGILKKIVFYIALILIWELVYRISNTFSSPVDVMKSLVFLTKTKILVIAVVDSMKRLFLGYVLSIIIGSILAIIIMRFKYIDENLTPLLLGFQTLPNVCWVPFSVFLFGVGENAITFIVVVGSAFGVTTAIESSIKGIAPIYKKAAQTMGASGLRLYSNVILPAALPSMVLGFKQSWSFAWRGLIAGEMVSAETGLGRILVEGRDLNDISQITAVMIVIVAVGLLLDRLVFGKIENSIRQKWGLENN